MKFTVQILLTHAIRQILPLSLLQLSYLPCLSHVLPALIWHMFSGHSKALPYPFPLLSPLYSSSHNNRSKAVLCRRTRCNVSSPQAITIQTDFAMAGYQLLISFSGRLPFGPHFLFCLLVFLLSFLFQLFITICLLLPDFG